MREHSAVDERPVHQADQPAYYEIRLDGPMQAHWSEWLGDMQITTGLGGQTLLEGWVADQTALFGILARIRDLGLVLVSINRLNKSEEDYP